MLTRKPTDLGHGPLTDDYTILEDGRVIGRVLKYVHVTSDPWVWSITGRKRPQIGDYGHAPTLEAALAAFKEAWQRGPG